MSHNISVLLVGTGEMAIEYAKVLLAQGISFQVIGRGEKKARIFEKATGITPLCGGVDNNLTKLFSKPTHAIVATGIPELADVTIKLMEFDIRKILEEKPGGLYKGDIERIKTVADRTQSNVYIAYNRRFYASTGKARQIIEEDGGVSSFYFEFTEWPHVIENLIAPDKVKQQWLYANSSHVIDLAFFLGGNPRELVCFSQGELSWHRKGSSFTGAGVSEKGALFCYNADWEAPGRWSVEVLTPKHRLYFKPMEQLQIQKKNSVEIMSVDIDDELDKEYKPGLYEEVYSFLSNPNDPRLTKVDDQLRNWSVYEKIEKGCNSKNGES